MTVKPHANRGIPTHYVLNNQNWKYFGTIRLGDTLLSGKPVCDQPNLALATTIFFDRSGRKSVPPPALHMQRQSSWTRVKWNHPNSVGWTAIWHVSSCVWNWICIDNSNPLPSAPCTFWRGREHQAFESVKPFLPQIFTEFRSKTRSV